MVTTSPGSALAGSMAVMFGAGPVGLGSMVKLAPPMAAPSQVT